MMRPTKWLMLNAVAMLLPIAATAGAAQPPSATPPSPAPAPAATDPKMAAPAAGTYLTQDQLVQAYREKQYPLVMRESARILANPATARSYSRFNVLVLRGESLLQTKNFDAAKDTFASAIKEAPDADKAAVMTASVMMIQHRHGENYISTATDENGAPFEPGQSAAAPVKISLLDLSKREAVFRALFWDQVASAHNTIAAIKMDPAWLTRIGDEMDRLDTISMLEKAIIGAQDQTTSLRKDLATAAEAVLSATVVVMENRITALKTQAKTIETVWQDPSGPRTIAQQRQQQIQVSRMRGLREYEVRELRDIQARAGQIAPSADDVVKRLNANSALFEPVKNEARDARKKVDDLIDFCRDAGALR